MEEYTRGYNACNRKWRENIKDKIEEVEKRKQEYEEENTIDEDYLFDMNGYNSAILVLQELLESED